MLNKLDHIRNIIFDFGGVIINLDFKLTLNAFRELGAEISDNNIERFLQKSFFRDFEEGKLTPQNFRNELRKYIPQTVSDEKLDSAWNKLLLDIPKERIALLERLKNKYRLLLLSNSNQIHYDYYVNYLNNTYGYKDYSELFSETYFSFQIKMLKPSLKIFEFVLEQSNIKPEETLFIDDTFQHVESARKLGINGYWVQGNSTIIDLF